MADRDEYVDLAIRALRQLAEDRLVFTMSEAEARLAESPPDDSSRSTIDPHHLTTARRMLTDAGMIDSHVGTGWGGHQIEIYNWTDATDTAIKAATSAKRAAAAQFLGWALGSKRHPNGLMGPAAETAVSVAIERAAGEAGYKLVPRGSKGVEELFGQPVPHGPLDNAVHAVQLDPHGIPTGAATVVVEVKNLRDWIYPNSPQLYQLLAKASSLQTGFPGQAIVPVFVCRRAHYTTYKMAKHLGFYVIESRVNFVKPTADVASDDVERVREALGFFDLLVTDQPGGHLLRQFATYLPKSINEIAAKWHRTAHHLEPTETLAHLRHPNLGVKERARDLNALRELAAQIPFNGRPGGW